MNRVYEFKGAVLLFDRIIANNYTATTTAPSVRKARSNITYRCKRDMGYDKNARISLSGTFKIVSEEEGN